MPIDYWDYLGWKDTLADSRFSARQKAYSHMRGDRDVYTPQAIVNGAAHVIGSDRARIEGAIKDTGKTDRVMSVPVTMTLSGKQLTVSVAAGKDAMPANVARSGCARFRSRCRSRSARAKIAEKKSSTTTSCATWSRSATSTGNAGSWTVPLDSVMRDGVDAAAVLIQDGNRDKPGPMLGAAFTTLH